MCSLSPKATSTNLRATLLGPRFGRRSRTTSVAWIVDAVDAVDGVDAYRVARSHLEIRSGIRGHANGRGVPVLARFL